jgi:sugar phosphate isomerase/epimerase
MKLSVITDEIDTDLERALQVVREFPIEQVELRTLWGTNLAEADDTTLMRARQQLKQAGLGVCSLATPVFKTDLFGTSEQGALHGASAAPLEHHFALLERCLQLAHFFEAPLLRIFAFWRAGELTSEREDQIVAILERVLPQAERANILLALENEHSCQVGTGAELARILRRIRSPYLRAVWDPGNAFVLGENAHEGYAAIQPWVVHIHLKDGVRESDGSVRWVIVGEGEVGYPQHLEQIAQSGYRGFLSLETHARVEGLSQAEVSRRCLQRLQHWLEQNTLRIGGHHGRYIG